MSNQKRSVVDAFVINANGKEERLLQSVKEGSMKRSGNEQQKEATHQGAIVSPSSVPSESAIRESVDSKKEIVGVVDEIYMKIFENCRGKEPDQEKASRYSTDMEALRQRKRAI